MYRSTWCDIDTAQFRTNVATLKALSGTKLLQVLKANAYGHGLVPMAHEAVAAGADMLGVATIGEAEQLLVAGVEIPILLMCGLDPQEISWAVTHSVHFLAWRSDQFETAMLVARESNQRPFIHVEIDSGMSRSGCRPEDFPTLFQSVTSEMRAAIFGLATHFPSADEEQLDSSEEQLEKFLGCVDIVNRAGLYPLVHAANSPATMRMPSARLDMVRMGVAAYGLSPSDFATMPPGVAPVLSWKAKITNITSIEAGRGVTYGWEYVAAEPETVATLAVGYADGYQRKPSAINSVMLHGFETPVLGRVCMDQCVIRIPKGIEASLGDVAALLDETITADTLADRWGTNNYDVVAGIRGRVPRVYG